MPREEDVEVWKYFDVKKVNKLKKEATCKHCGKFYSFASCTKLRKHLKSSKCRNIQSSQNEDSTDPDELNLDSPSSSNQPPENETSSDPEVIVTSTAAAASTSRPGTRPSVSVQKSIVKPKPTTSTTSQVKLRGNLNNFLDRMSKGESID